MWAAVTARWTSNLYVVPGRFPKTQSSSILRGLVMEVDGTRRLRSTTPCTCTASKEARTAQDTEIIDELVKIRTFPARRLSNEEITEQLYNNLPEHASAFAAFYSSELGGIVTDPAMMFIPVDDHMAHRGSAVFDTATLVNGHLYQLDQHLARFLTSAEKAKLKLPCSPQQMRRTILETTAASCKMHGHVRYWLSAGRGGFGLNPRDCIRPAFYVMVYEHKLNDAEKLVLRGWKVKTSPVPMKPNEFATMKSTNYMQNALNLLDAQETGFNQGIFVDGEGYISEGPNMNVGIITPQDELLVPTFENSLAGITVQRLMELTRQNMDDPDIPISAVVQRKVTLEEAKNAKEVMLVGSSLPVMAVVQWDDTKIGDGTVGVGVLALRDMMLNDLEEISGDQHYRVPYGFLTGMEDDYID